MRTRTLLLAAFAALLGACTQIDTGNVGVESSLGQVKEQTLPPGMYGTVFKTVTEVCAKELPLSISDLRPQTSDKITLSDLDIDVYVQIDAAKAAVIATKWAGDRTDVAEGGCVALGMNYVTRQAREAVYDVASKFGSATIHTERTKIAADTVKALQASLDNEAGKGMFFVRSANIRNLVTDPALEKNIKDAANAQFQLQAERNQLEVTKVTAERQRVAAQGEADAIRIKAEAVSKNGGAEYVQLKWIEKWNGQQPTTQLGAGATPMVHVGK
ncbi:SPFH domain-containing protein [Piscinibacter gummiphilus]|uniref:SPFH domain-containing protein n=1 Tax=Piscinibacter gummiphilus TaxID=946333 RepID=A0ABZ0CNI9_9BURK|nr:SPFH domain-containing protein [Piscinibacter gummiphilus]WOB06542.1 SPFH domain-containing protein [Piscinibacter gummiphilus]